MSRFRHFTIAVLAASLAILMNCSIDRERDATLMDTGLPLSESMRAYDVERYTLRQEILVPDKAIAGSATVAFRALHEMDTLELDFDGAYEIDRVESNGIELDYRQTDAKLIVTLAPAANPGEARSVTVFYEGVPVEATHPPWDGGFTWARTPAGKPWIATSFQGEGCDIWWPCKDHPSDEPNGVDLYITVPRDLTVAANGVLVEVVDEPRDRHTFHWQTNVSTNNYGIALNIAPYVAIEGKYESVNGTVIPVVFYAIEDHEDAARALFDKEMYKTIEFFERVVGPYPWGQEKLGIAETPHLGMEHQTINAYGNEFKRDSYGFDWLLHHEFAHEWFGNLVSARNYADLWLHEGFGAYMQIVYTQEQMGDAAAHHRLYSSYLKIDPCQPVAPRGDYSDDQMNADGKGPAVNIYTKGAWVIHSLRYLLGEARFWDAVRLLVYGTTEPDGLQPPIEARQSSTDEFAAIVSEVAGTDTSWFFEVYLRSGELPELVSEQDGEDVLLTWHAPDDLSFDMPVPVRVGDTIARVEFRDNRARLLGTRVSEIQIDPQMQILRQLPSLPTCQQQRAETEESDST